MILIPEARLTFPPITSPTYVYVGDDWAPVTVQAFPGTNNAALLTLANDLCTSKVVRALSSCQRGERASTTRRAESRGDQIMTKERT